VRKGISAFSRVGELTEGIRSLERDLASGDWDLRYGHLLAEEALDLGYRIVMASPEGRGEGSG